MTITGIVSRIRYSANPPDLKVRSFFIVVILKHAHFARHKYIFRRQHRVITPHQRNTRRHFYVTASRVIKQDEKVTCRSLLDTRNRVSIVIANHVSGVAIQFVLLVTSIGLRITRN